MALAKRTLFMRFAVYILQSLSTLPSAIKAFFLELAPFVTSKGAVQFPLDHPLPAKLICRMVRFRVAENIANARLKAAAKKKR